eukprot:3949118-Prymnesium_polylepis.1
MGERAGRAARVAAKCSRAITSRITSHGRSACITPARRVRGLLAGPPAPRRAARASGSRAACASATGRPPPRIRRVPRRRLPQG